MTSDQEKYFFDYPVVDVNALSASALRLMYHGSTHGAFGSYGSAQANRPPINLRRIEAFKISLEHLSSTPLSDAYAYNLVYFNREISDNLWNGKKRDASPKIKEFSRRVLLAASPSLNAKRYRTPFWIRFEKPVYIAKYDKLLTDDHYVPINYLQEFHDKFQGFLMRTKIGYPLVRNIFEAYGLSMGERREVVDELDGTLQVLSYTF